MKLATCLIVAAIALPTLSLASTCADQAKNLQTALNQEHSDIKQSADKKIFDVIDEHGQRAFTLTTEDTQIAEDTLKYFDEHEDEDVNVVAENDTEPCKVSITSEKNKEHTVSNVSIHEMLSATEENQEENKE